MGTNPHSSYNPTCKVLFQGWNQGNLHLHQQLHVVFVSISMCCSTSLLGDAAAAVSSPTTSLWMRKLLPVFMLENIWKMDNFLFLYLYIYICIASLLSVVIYVYVYYIYDKYTVIWLYYKSCMVFFGVLLLRPLLKPGKQHHCKLVGW